MCLDEVTKTDGLPEKVEGFKVLKRAVRYFKRNAKATTKYEIGKEYARDTYKGLETFVVSEELLTETDCVEIGDYHMCPYHTYPIGEVLKRPVHSIETDCLHTTIVIDEKMIDDNVGNIYTSHIEKYSKGYHVWETIEGAREWRDGENNIYSVTLEKVHTYGTQNGHNVYVGTELTVHGKVK